MEECVELSKSLGKRVGDELDIPIFLYEMSSAKPSRSNLSVIRSGEYEGLSKSLVIPNGNQIMAPQLSIKNQEQLLLVQETF